MKFLILVFSRLVRLFANLVKIFSYIFHFIWKDKRFEIPSHASPLIRSAKARKIPRVIWQTNFTNMVTLPVYCNYIFNRIISPTFEHRFMVTSERTEYVGKNFSPEIFKSYSKLQIGAAQADFWRVLVLHREGGVYMDVDAYAVWPLELSIKKDFDSLFLETKGEKLSNYFIASKKENDDLLKVIDKIVYNIESTDLKNVFDITGPGVFNSVLDFSVVNKKHYRYLCNQGGFTNEYFQYIDKPAGKWNKEQFKVDAVKKD